MDNIARGTHHEHGGCLRLKVAGDVVAKVGEIAAIDLTTGFLTVGAVSTDLLTVGTFAEDVDTTGKADGAPFGDYEEIGPLVSIREAPSPRFFWFFNAAGGDAFAQADMGQIAYINGARETTKTSTGRSVLGRAVDLSTDATRVRVDLKPFGA